MTIVFFSLFQGAKVFKEKYKFISQNYNLFLKFFTNRKKNSIEQMLVCQPVWFEIILYIFAKNFVLTFYLCVLMKQRICNATHNIGCIYFISIASHIKCGRWLMSIALRFKEANVRSISSASKVPKASISSPHFVSNKIMWLLKHMAVIKQVTQMGFPHPKSTSYIVPPTSCETQEP